MNDQAIVNGNARILSEPNGFARGWRETEDGLFCSECGHQAHIARITEKVRLFLATDWCMHCGARMCRYTRGDHGGEEGTWKRRRNMATRCSLCGAERLVEGQSYCTSCGATMR